jgi:hypothetical protein
MLRADKALRPIIQVPLLTSVFCVLTNISKLKPSLLSWMLFARPSTLGMRFVSCYSIRAKAATETAFVTVLDLIKSRLAAS